MFTKSKDNQRSIKELQSIITKSEQNQKELQSSIDTKSARIKELEDAERSLNHWKEREPKIMYYLGVFKETME